MNYKLRNRTKEEIFLGEIGVRIPASGFSDIISQDQADKIVGPRLDFVMVPVMLEGDEVANESEAEQQEQKAPKTRKAVEGKQEKKV